MNKIIIIIKKINKELAVKRIEIKSVPKTYRESILMRNMKILMKLNHQNIVKAYQLVKTQKTAFIFMDYLKNDCIKDFMQKRFEPLEENESKIWFKDMINAINYLHCKGIAHRRISLRCFILDSNNKLILCGFDFPCISMTQFDETMSRRRCSYTEYKSPEMFLLENGHRFNPKASDIYSL
jgi:serine/threonine protein kinase